MLSIETQISSGRMVCPRTHQRLSQREGELVTADGSHRYDFADGVPVFVTEVDDFQISASVPPATPTPLPQVATRLLQRVGDFRTYDSLRALGSAVDWRGAEELCLSIGGGPVRHHRQLVNVNIGRWDNVDVVASAYELPYADGTVDSIHCEAVVEHLERPNDAVREMYRVLREGGEVYAATPFLCAFHAFPNHFQNFTLAGHRRLFERAGFGIVSAGLCVGPSFAITELATQYVSSIAPTWRIVRWAAGAMAIALLPLRVLDRYLNRKPGSHGLASSTYVHARKVTAPTP